MFSHHAFFHSITPGGAFRNRCLAAWALLFLSCPWASAQGDKTEPLLLARVAPSTVRSQLTGAYTNFEVVVENRGSEARNVRVVAFYSARPDVQYGRDLWIPGHTTLTTWMLVGAAPAASGGAHQDSRDVKSLLIDRTGGSERIVRPPGEENIRGQAFFYRENGPFATVLLDHTEYLGDKSTFLNASAQEVLDVIRTFRQGKLRLYYDVFRDSFLPLTSEGLDGVDYVVLATNRIANDPPGQAAMRRWLERGGTLWVMLDRTNPDAFAALLGDRLPFEIVDRTSLNRVQIISPSLKPEEQDTPLLLEEPVAFVRVATTAEDTVQHTVHGWPASFTRSFGRGTILFTTVGARAWFRPGGFEYLGGPKDGIPQRPLEELALKFEPLREPRTFYQDALEPLIAGEIGYEVPARGTALVYFGAFLASVLIVGVALRQWQRLELAALFGPLAAIAAAAAFIALGENSRSAVPASVAAAEIIDVAPSSIEQEATGRLAYYRPNSGSTPLASADGGMLQLDESALEGQTRRRIMTDAMAWHWEGLDLPAGLRLGSFRRTIAANEQPRALAQFNADGISGQVSAGAFRDLGDFFLSTPTRKALAARFSSDGRFTAGSRDLLPAGQYLSNVVLTDLQQRRAALYQRLLVDSDPRRTLGRTMLYAWAQAPTPLPFTIDPNASVTNSSLLAIPVEFERPPPGTPVTVSSAFVSFERIVNGMAGKPTLESAAQTDMRLRFQLPKSVLPLEVERAHLFITVRAPLRRFSVGGYDKDGTPRELRASESPAGPIEVDITQPNLLTLDSQGGIYLNVVVGKRPGEDAIASTEETESRWSIDALALEVTGKTQTKN
jgi:hypothetical protein